MSDPYALNNAIEDAIEEISMDQGKDGDEIYHDVAMMILREWPDQKEAARYARANQIGYP